MSRDYYAILGLREDATPMQIKRAFRRRALEVHPDRSGLHSEPFVELQRAYETLSDPVQRRAYDRERSTAPSSRLWLNRERTVRGADLEVLLSREEARRGGTLRIEIPVRRDCPGCEDDWPECPVCGGTGTVETGLPFDLDFPAGVRSGHFHQVRLSPVHFLSVQYRIVSGGSYT